MKIHFNNIVNTQSLMNEIKASHFMSEIDRKTKIIATAIIGTLALILVISLLYRRFKVSEVPASTTDDKKAVASDNSSKAQNTDQKSESMESNQITENSKDIKPNQSTQTPTATPTTQPVLKPTTPKDNPAQDTLPPSIEITAQQPESNRPIEQAPIVEDADEDSSDPLTTERILYLGSNGSHLQLSELEQLEAEFEEYCKDKIVQKQKFFNERDGVIFISRDKFKKSKKLSDFQLTAFIRHLVLNNKIHAYNPNVLHGTCLYLTIDALKKNAIPNLSPNAPNFFDRKKLLEMDHYMQEIETKFPAMDQFPEGNKDTIERILSDIREAHYARISLNDFHEKVVSAAHLSAFPRSVRKILDTLVEHGTIYAWGGYTYSKINPVLKLKELDPQAIQSIVWRDLTAIKIDKEFQENNQLDKVKILSLDIKISGVSLNLYETKDLSDLIDELNRRVKHGPFTWKPKGFAHVYDKMLDTLTTEGMIYSYERQYIDGRIQYKIHVKEIDSKS